MIVNYLLGFVSAFFGFLLSPHESLVFDSKQTVFLVIKNCSVFGLCLGLVSQVNGHNIFMFIRSKVDYFVNLAVAASLGCVVAVFVLYMMRYELVGRWIVFIIAFSYFSSVVFFDLLNIKNNGVCIWVIGKNCEMFTTMVNSLGLKRVRQIYSTAECDFDFQAMKEIVDKRVGNQIYYLIGDSQCPTIGNVAISKWDSNILQRVFAINLIFEHEFGVVCLDDLQAQNWWDISTELRRGGYGLFKRLLDICVAILILLLATPLVLFVALLVRISDGGPVLYTQVRLGQYGKPFKIWKLRTMRTDAEKNGAQWAANGDARITSIGFWLRRSRIDELPQVWNILRGDMSIIGPRPERPEFYSLISKDLPKFNIRLTCKPGLTGWAQINYPYGASVHDSKIKLMYDIYYIKNAGVLLDLRILTRTLVAMVKGAR